MHERCFFFQNPLFEVPVPLDLHTRAALIGF
jgi:hypothetical protein